MNMDVTDCCRVCLRIEPVLTPITALDLDSIKLSDKLFCCISEINWLKDDLIMLICTACLATLRICYDFKIMCLQSDNTLQQYCFERNPEKQVLTIASNDVVINSSLVTVTAPEEQPHAAQSSAEFLRTFLDGEDLSSGPTDVSDLIISRSGTPDDDDDALATHLVGSDGGERVKRPRNTRSVKTQTQGLPQYPTLTPAAARLEAQLHRATPLERDPPTKHLCGLCGKTYAKSTNLKIHMRTHTGEKPFECKYCVKRFYHSSHLREHIRRHTGEKPFQCSVCAKRFTITAELKVHMRIHTGEKPYACTCCEKRYIKAADLQVHMRTHTGEKPYACAVCVKRFASAYILNAHMKTHTGDRPWTCKVCAKGFTQSSHLTVHLKKHEVTRLI